MAVATAADEAVAVMTALSTKPERTSLDTGTAPAPFRCPVRPRPGPARHDARFHRRPPHRRRIANLLARPSWSSQQNPADTPTVTPDISSLNPANSRPSRAADYVLLEWEYAQGQQSPLWHLRYGEFCHTLPHWTDADRTNFWYDLATLVNRDSRLAPTPDLLLTPGMFAREISRMWKVVDAVNGELRAAGRDPHSEDCKRPDWCSDPDCEPQRWLRFAKPIVWSFDEADLGRYLGALTAHARDC